MVVTARPATSASWVWQEKARLPSICTMQAPHRPAPQPNFVPVSLRPSRITHNNGVAAGASVDAALPFTVKLIAISLSFRVPGAVDLRFALLVRSAVSVHFARGQGRRRALCPVPALPIRCSRFPLRPALLDFGAEICEAAAGDRRPHVGHQLQ